MPVASSLNYHPEPERRRAVGASAPKLGGISLTNEECRLRWPRRLFADEARLIIARSDEKAQRLLLRDAFVDPWIADSLPHNPARPAKVLAFLADNVDPLPEGATPPPLTYQQRQAGAARPVTGNGALQLSAFVSLVNDLVGRGYFARQLTAAELGNHSSAEGAIGRLRKELGWQLSSWPLDSYMLTDKDDPFDPMDTARLFDLVEILHRHVARPRTIDPGEEDSWGNQYPDTYADFNPAVGRAIYRYQVNGLLARANVPLRLADDGEDVGRLVSTTDEARTELLDRMTARTDPTTRERVDHAISLFLRRGATEEDKRSACIALAGVLEERRSLLKEHLTGPDEGALFEIANRFAIRHRRADQSTAYSPLFLDWVFWAYLSTVDLTDRLLSDRSGTTTP